MERWILPPRTEILSGKWDFVKGRPKFSNGISEWKMSVPFASFYCFQVFWLGSPLIPSSRKKPSKWNEDAPLEISFWDLSRPINYNCRPTVFFRVNGNQPTNWPFSERMKNSMSLANFSLTWRLGPRVIDRCNACVTSSDLKTDKGKKNRETSVQSSRWMKTSKSLVAILSIKLNYIYVH